jgi:hypothetical protein
MSSMITLTSGAKSRSFRIAGMLFCAVLIVWPMASWAANRVNITTGKTGQPAADTVFLGSPYEFRVAIENDVTLAGISLGLQITSPDGVEWRWDTQPNGYGPSGYGTGGQYLTVFPQSRMDPVTTVWDFSGLLVGERDVDGISPDTIFPGATAVNGGLPPGPLQDMMAIHFTALRTGTGDVGALCIDSCFAPPAGDWLFVSAENSSSIVPDIAGPFCWPVVSNPGLRPMIVVAYSPVNIIITDPDGLQFGKDEYGNLINEISGATYYEDPHDSVVIDNPKIGNYDIGFIGEVGSGEEATFSSIIKVDGLQEETIAADATAPDAGVTASFGYTVEEGYNYINGDANRDETVNIMDAVYLVEYVFRGGMAPDPEPSGDANCNGVVNIEDAVYLINYIFKGGPPPCFFVP